MSLLYGGKSGDSCDDDDGNDRNKYHGDRNEEQESRCLIRYGVREAATPVHHEFRKLIHNFNRDNYSCSQP